MQRLAVADRGQRDLQLLRATAQCRVVRYRQPGEAKCAQTLRETLQRPQRQAKHLFQPQQHLNHCVSINAWPATSGRTLPGHVRQDACVNPHGHIASRDQARVVLSPIPDSINPFGLLAIAIVFAHLPGEKSRMYAVHPEVNRGAVTTVARKRQIGARYTDLCNNAHCTS
ncbi:conserved hypothetical protein [Ricinus communis]|uniref:Uncharacterized protein n=1 Tax=Ricinus communis TaxID=3988 RepID=B9TGP8_RICCO|nr:conserved hypothetical protein [Ricinus communis]